MVPQEWPQIAQEIECMKGGLGTSNLILQVEYILRSVLNFEFFWILEFYCFSFLVGLGFELRATLL
jgi:hypothetical protein